MSVRIRAGSALPVWLRAWFLEYLNEHADEVRALARSTDPSTSHDAARRLRPIVLRQIWERVLTLFYLYGPMRDEVLTDLYRTIYDSHLPPGSSTVRSRRHELELLGLLRDTGIREEMALTESQSCVWDFAQFVYDVIGAREALRRQEAFRRQQSNPSRQGEDDEPAHS